MLQRSFGKSLHIIGAVTALALSLACGSPQSASQPTAEPKASTGAPASTAPAAAVSAPAPAEAKLATNQSLKVRFYDDPSGFDPATLFRIETENIAFNIYSGLTTYDGKTAKIIPDLAESWETSPDAKTWTFKLRKGVQWQKGYGEMTSADVKFSYDRMMSAETGSPYRAEFNNVEAIQTPDPYTVVIALKNPDGNFLHQVANYHQGQVVKKEAIEKAGDQYKWNPVGTGPFALESYAPGAQIVLVRHDGYFRGPAKLEKITFPIIKDDETAAIALQNGEVDLAMRVAVQETLTRLEKDDRFTLNKAGGGISITMFNPVHPPFADARVRKAWAHALDRPAIIKATTPFTSSPFTNFVNDWMDIYSPEHPKYEYNPEKAKELLAEANLAGGFTAKNLTTSSGGVTEAMQLEKSYLAKVGITLDFELVDTPTFNQRRNQADFQVATRLLPAMNPDTILFSYLHPDNFAPKGLNSAKYNSPELTTKLEAARAETDPAKRAQLYSDIQKIALTDFPYMPNSVSVVYWPGYKWVDGVAINPLSQVNFYDVRMLAK
ncbi:MAG: ABC transporter substrate-binding protein [Chloroflexota bacterium]